MVSEEAKAEIKRLGENVDSIGRRMDNYEKILIEQVNINKRLSLALVGDSELKIDGLINRQERSEIAIDKFEGFLNWIMAVKWTIVTVLCGGIAGMVSIIAVLYQILQHIQIK